MTAAERPYVDRPVSDLGSARAAAEQALASWGIAAAPSLLRRGMNALFAVPGEPAVLRVGHATAPAAASHALLDALSAAGLPVPQPYPGWAADVGEFAVTGWRRVRESQVPVRWEQLGGAVRRLHELSTSAVPEAYPMPAPSTFPWWDFDVLLADVAADVDRQALQGLAAAVARNAWWREAVVERPVVCHGDVHPGNVLVSPSGPLLIDWDLLCWADPAWDHAPLMAQAERWGGDPEMYPRFADGYGRSLADDPLGCALAELRNVAATLMRVRAARTDPAAAPEAERRLRFWRGDADAPMWRAQ